MKNDNDMLNRGVKDFSLKLKKLKEEFSVFTSAHASQVYRTIDCILCHST